MNQSPVSCPSMNQLPVCCPSVNQSPVSCPWMNQLPVCCPWMNQSPVSCPWMNQLPVHCPWMNQSPVCCPWMNQLPVCQWIQVCRDWMISGCEETEWSPGVRKLNDLQVWDWMTSRCAETEWSPGVRRLLTSLCWWVNILTNRKESVSASIALQTWSHLPQEQISVMWTDIPSSEFSLPMIPSFDVLLFF